MNHPDAIARRHGTRTFRLSLLTLAMASLFFAPSAWADTIEGDGTNAIGVGACNPTPITPPDKEQNTEYGVGAGCNTNGSHNVGLGYNAGSNVNGILNVAVGDKAGSFVVGQSNTAIGDFAGARITGDGNTSLGSYANNAGSGASITVDDATAVGSRSMANADRGTALGSHAEVTGYNSVALGAHSTDGGEADVVSIGAHGATRRIIHVTAGIADTDGVNVSQLRPLVDGLGGGAAINPSTGEVTGPTYDVGGATYNNVGDAIDALDTAGGDPNLLISGGNTYSKNAAALPAGASQGVAIGENAAVGATGAGNTAVGVNSSATGDLSSSSAFGSGATASDNGTTAVGVNAVASADSATALGATAQAGGLHAVALGSMNVAGGTNSIAIGYANQVTGDNSGAMGDPNMVGGTGSYAVGNNNNIANNNTFVLGNGVATTQDNSVVLGNGSTDSAAAATGGATIGGNGYTFAGAAPVGVVSVGSAGGERQVQNVAAGRLGASSTDAVNGSQLYATNQQVDINTGDIATNKTNITNLATQVNQPITFTGNDDNAGPVGVKLGGSLAIKGDATTAGTYSGANVKTVTDAATGAISIQLADSPKFGNVTINEGNTGVISGVSDGVDGDDAVNKSQLDEVAAAAGKGWNLSAQGANAGNVAPGSTVDLNNGDGNIQVSKAAGSNDVTFDLADDIALDSVTTGNSVLDSNGLSVDDGTSQTTYGASGMVINGGPRVTINGIDAGDLKITHVAAGDLSATSTDAVNGSQLYATNQAVTNLGDQINNGSAGMFQVSQDHNAPPPAPTGQDAAAGGAGAVASGDASLAVGNGSTASGNDSTALGNGASASGAGSTAIGQGAQASADGSVALGSGASDGGRGAESYTGKYSGAANDTVGTVSVGNAATGETRTISNVADAKEATDAVNLRQLDGAVQESKDYTDQQVTKINNSVTNIENGSAGMFQVSPDANGTAPTPTGEESVAGGNNAVASGDHSTALGDDSVASADNSVALGHGSVADRANSVSVGSDGHERQVTHVAAGTEATDAVNVSQLKDSQAGSVQYVRNQDGSIDYSQVTLNPGGGSSVVHNVAAGESGTDAVNVAQLESGMNEVKDWSKNYTDQRFQSVNRDLNTIGNRANAGIASAMAMASLPQAYAPDQSAVAVSLGGFHGEASVAIGLSTVTDSGRYVFKLNASSNTRGDAGVGVGAAMVW